MLVEPLAPPFLVSRYIRIRRKKEYVPLYLDELIAAADAGGKQKQLTALLVERETAAPITLCVLGVFNERLVLLLYESYKDFPSWPDIERPSKEDIQDALIRIEQKADRKRLQRLSARHKKVRKAITDYHEWQRTVSRRAKGGRKLRVSDKVAAVLTVDLCREFYRRFQAREFTDKLGEKDARLVAETVLSHPPFVEHLKANSVEFLTMLLQEPRARREDILACAAKMTGAAPRTLENYQTELSRIQKSAEKVGS